MKCLPDILLTSLLLVVTSVSWAGCPSGYVENQRTGDCEPIRGLGLNLGTDWVWCVMQEGVWRVQADSCEVYKGKAFSTISEATAEHNRLALDQKVWCVTKHTFYWTSRAECKNGDGSVYKSRSEAKNAFRLTSVSPSVVNPTSLTFRSNVKDGKVYVDGIFKGSSDLDFDLPKGKYSIRIEKDGYVPFAKTINLIKALVIDFNMEKAGEKTVELPSTEIVFWQSIQASNDPELFRAYINQFPTGIYVSIAKIKLKNLDSDSTSVTRLSIPDLNYGRYHALVIGNNEYDYLGDLETPINDATRVAFILKNAYGFRVKLLKNARRSDIVSSLAEFRKTTSWDDNFLLYYAGHGYRDKAADEGYWLPVDAKDEDPSNWIQNDTIVAQLRGMQAKHAMVVADSCFSGKIFRDSKLVQRTPDWLSRVVNKKARTVLTSGGDEPVMDSGGGTHSVFAKAFISQLEENTGVLDATQLFIQLRPKVIVNSPQTPEYGSIYYAGHDGGDFLFVRR